MKMKIPDLARSRMTLPLAGGLAVVPLLLTAPAAVSFFVYCDPAASKRQNARARPGRQASQADSSRNPTPEDSSISATRPAPAVALQQVSSHPAEPRPPVIIGAILPPSLVRTLGGGAVSGAGAGQDDQTCLDGCWEEYAGCMSRASSDFWDSVEGCPGPDSGLHVPCRDRCEDLYREAVRDCHGELNTCEAGCPR